MKFKFYLALSFLLGTVFTAAAQGPPSFDTTVDDATAPIPGILAVILIALGLGARKLLKKK